MKAMIAAAAIGLGLLAAQQPANAGGEQTTYPTWEDCLAFIASDNPKNQFIASCVQAPSGEWYVVWTFVPKGKGGNKR